MNKLGGLFYACMICWIPMSSAIGFSDDINYPRLYDSAKAVHPNLVRDEAILKSKAGRFSEVLEFIRDHVPGGRTCFLSHASNPREFRTIEEERLYEYYDQSYHFLVASLKSVGFETLFDLRTDDPRLGIGGNNTTIDFCKRAGDVNHALAVFVPYYKERYGVENSGVRIEFDCILARHDRDRSNLHYYVPLLLDGNLNSSIPATPFRDRLYQNFRAREGNRFFYDDFFDLLRDRLMTSHQDIVGQAKRLFDNLDLPIPGQRRDVPDPESPIMQLQRGMESRTADIERITRYIMDYPQITDFRFIVGPVGSGKTILAHLLAGRNLQIRRIPNRGFCLEARTHEDRLPGFDIGHGTAAGTRFPAIWQDGHSFIVDCTGFGDPEGPVTDILNAFSVQQLFQGRNVKVILAVNEPMIRRRHEYQNLKKLLGDLVGFFRNDEDLKHSLSLVLTQREDIDLGELDLESDRPGQSISSFISTDVLPYFADDGYLAARYERSRSLLRFFAEHPHRVSSLRKAERQEGPFVCDREMEAMRRVIRNADYVNLLVTLEIGRDARDFVATVIRQRNIDLVGYLSTTGSQRITNFCNARIEDRWGSIRELRLFLRGLSTKLRNLSGIPSSDPMRFSTEIRNARVMDTDELNTKIQQLSFLRTLNDELDINLVFQTRNWGESLRRIIEQIDALSADPEVRYNAPTQTLYIRSVFLGANDIQGLSTSHPMASSVYAYAWNTVLFDSPVIHHGKSLVIIAPTWRALVPCLIDLSGLKGGNGASGANGAPGKDGKPGSPGQSGGHFFGQFSTFEGSTHLRIDTSGGQGGNGGNGGNGANGQDGVDGNKEWCISRGWSHHQPTGDHHGPNWCERSGTEMIYDGKGTPGTAGLNGGRGGHKGKGGYSGNVSGVAHLFYRSENGASGHQDGTPGKAGKGGKHGRNHVGHIIKDIRYRDMRDDEDRDCIREMGSGSEPDRVITSIGYLEWKEGEEKAPNGQPGSGISEVRPTPPVRNLDLNEDTIHQDYRERYEEARQSDRIVPFVIAFPGLGL
ncbi:MAG: hypothetical protein JSS34_07250 [Proteobacteria bacterium]|nr:hypothetical protein [Pseudomonadota bacterium]